MRHRRFYSELKRRRVVRMAAWYGAGAFVVVQFVDLVQDALYLPPWLLTLSVVAALAGLPIALLLSWQFDITPDGKLAATPQRRGRETASRGDWRRLGIPLLIVVGISVAALSTGNTRRLFAVGGVPALVCADGSSAPCVHIEPMQANRFVVLPLSHREGTDPALLDGEICAYLIAEGLAQWHDFNVADHLRVNDALRRLPADERRHVAVDTGLAIAHEVGAGKLIMGELWGIGDTTRITASLYDVASRRIVRQRQARFHNGSDQAKQEFYRLARQLVLDDARMTVGAPAAAATTSYASLIAYDSALKAVRVWDLAAARRYFETALQRDPAYPHAHLWLAYTLLWQNDTSDVLRFHAARAAAQARSLGPREAALARAVKDLSEQRYAEACDRYRAAVRQDSASFFAWSGLSECLARDNGVVADERSVSGWSFRASGEEAIRAQERALVLVPSFNSAFRNLTASRMGALLYRRSAMSRMGVGVADNARFAAFPALDHDTLAFTPYPLEEWSRQAVPATNAAVIERHRQIMRRIAEQWASAFPDNPRALEALAQSLERVREIDESEVINESALAAIRAARRLESDAGRRVIMSVAEVRMLVKASRFREARKLALKTLRETKQPTPGQARRLAALAALTGRGADMARLLRISAPEFDIDIPLTGERPQPPLELARAAGELLAYASLGGPRDSLRALNERAHDALNTYVAASERSVMHAAVLDRAARLTFSALGADDAHRDTRALPPHLEIQARLARRDYAAVHAGLAGLDSLRAGVPISDIAADGLLTEVELALAVGDTSRAIGKLDRYLSQLNDMSEPNFAQPYQPAALVRLMQTRAELAAASHDRATARMWSRRVIDLWQQGDATVKPALKRMRRFAR